MLMSTVNYLRAFNYDHEAANRKRKDYRNDKIACGSLYTNQPNKPSNMTNRTSTDVTFRAAWCSIVIAKQEDSYSIVQQIDT